MHILCWPSSLILPSKELRRWQIASYILSHMHICTDQRSLIACRRGFGVGSLGMLCRVQSTNSMVGILPLV